jgi:hypothetical protein
MPCLSWLSFAITDTAISSEQVLKQAASDLEPAVASVADKMERFDVPARGGDFLLHQPFTVEAGAHIGQQLVQHLLADVPKLNCHLVQLHCSGHDFDNQLVNLVGHGYHGLELGSGSSNYFPCTLMGHLGSDGDVVSLCSDTQVHELC